MTIKEFIRIIKYARNYISNIRAESIRGYGKRIIGNMRLYIGFQLSKER